MAVTMTMVGTAVATTIWVEGDFQQRRRIVREGVGGGRRRRCGRIARREGKIKSDVCYQRGRHDEGLGGGGNDLTVRLQDGDKKNYELLVVTGQGGQLQRQKEKEREKVKSDG